MQDKPSNKNSTKYPSNKEIIGRKIAYQILFNEILIVILFLLLYFMDLGR